MWFGKCFVETTLPSNISAIEHDLLICQGEPHLSAAYAVMMNYWEGVLHFLLFLIIIHRMFRG